MYPGQTNSPFTTTLGEISATDTAVVVADASVLPVAVPFLLTLGYDKSASETVLVTAVSGNTLTITRAVDGPALLWVAGTKAARVFTAKDLNDIQDNIRTLNQGKQENLTIDAAPTQGSGNPVSSGGVHSALAGKQDTLTIDSAPTSGSTNPVASGGVFSALAGKQPNLTFDAAPTQNSQNPVTSGGIHTALSAKANAASLASHTGNTSNPHKVTAAQIGAVTPAQVEAAIDDISCVGDLRTTIGAPSDNWLPCDGSGIYSADYPELVPLLQANSTMMEIVTIPSAVYGSGQSKYLQGAAYRNGTWVIAGSGYGNSNDLYIPVLYYATDPNGPWTEVRLAASGSYHISGILYNPKMYRWIAYGYKYVSSTECYPCIFHASSLNGTWFCNPLSSTTCCRLTTGYYADDKLVLLGRGCGSANYGYGYAYISTTQTVSFTEYNFTVSVYGIMALCFGGGYWAFVDNNTAIWYTADPAGTWSQNKLVSSGVQLSGLCYGDGTWCACGMQNSGGYGRLFHAASVTGKFKDVGVTSYDQNDAVAYADGVFVVLARNFSTLRSIIVSADHFTTWKVKEAKVNGRNPSSGYALVGGGERWLACGMSDVITIRHPEADAVLPELKPEFGTVYIKAK